MYARAVVFLTSGRVGTTPVPDAGFLFGTPNFFFFHQAYTNDKSQVRTGTYVSGAICAALHSLERRMLV